MFRSISQCFVYGILKERPDLPFLTFALTEPTNYAFSPFDLHYIIGRGFNVSKLFRLRNNTSMFPWSDNVSFHCLHSALPFCVCKPIWLLKTSQIYIWILCMLKKRQHMSLNYIPIGILSSPTAMTLNLYLFTFAICLTVWHKYSFVTFLKTAL